MPLRFYSNSKLHSCTAKTVNIMHFFLVWAFSNSRHDAIQLSTAVKILSNLSCTHLNKKSGRRMTYLFIWYESRGALMRTVSHSYASRNKKTQKPWRRYSGSTNYNIYQQHNLHISNIHICIKISYCLIHLTVRFTKWKQDLMRHNSTQLLLYCKWFKIIINSNW